MLLFRYSGISITQKKAFRSVPMPVIILLLAAAALGQSSSQKARPHTSHSGTLPLAPGAKVTDLMSKPGFFNEPSIAVNPKNPEQLVAGYQINASAAYSNDGAQIWSKAERAAPMHYKVSGDVSVGRRAAGAAQLRYIAFDAL